MSATHETRRTTTTTSGIDTNTHRLAAELGVVASIRHRGGDVDFAGPLDDDTIGALRAVGAEVGR